MNGFAVDLRGVSLEYPGPPPVRALRSIDLRIAVGDYVALTGQSGSGKSSLLNILGLLDRPTAGQYLLDQNPTHLLSEKQRAGLRATRIGFVFQAYHLLPERTVSENVELGMVYAGVPRPERRRLAVQALAMVGLGHRAAGLAGALSGGEKQRVALARAAANRPAILLCDEPTGNLDSASATVVLDVLDGFHSAGATILLITHDAGVARRAVRQVQLVDGLLRDGLRPRRADGWI